MLYCLWLLKEVLNGCLSVTGDCGVATSASNDSVYCFIQQKDAIVSHLSAELLMG